MTSQPTLANFAPPARHPARYSGALLPYLARYLAPGMRVLDPFGGVGGLAKLAYTGARIVIGEIELPIIEQAAGTRRVNANALHLPFASNAFGAIATSPTYGNRMADTFVDGSERNTYTAAFGFSLHANNSGAMQWGNAYRDLHYRAYLECRRVLKFGGWMLVNISDHIRAGVRISVSAWHFQTLCEMGFRPFATHNIPTPRNRKGQNGNARVECESIFVFIK